MTHSTASDEYAQEQHSLWSERDASDRRAMITEILAQVSMEALQGDTLEAMLQRIVDCVARRLPVAIASIILLNDEGTHFVQEVWSGIELDLPGELPWPVTIGASGRCVRSGEPQLIVDVEADADYVPGNCRVKSEYLVPIRHRAHLHGVLNLESTSADFFTPEVCAMFDAVALQIAGAVHLARVVRELELANRKLEQLSMSDGLTGIANRRSFDQRLAEEWQRHAKEGGFLALLLIDVDCFKALNDACGHVFGDECLRVLARLCAEIVQGTQAHVSRYGGEEFVLLLPGCNLADAKRLGLDLCRRIDALALNHPASIVADHVTVSIGVSAARPDPRQPPESLIVVADRALYEAKAKGRNGVVALPCA
ncbi:diguanylate cyclase [Rhodanobacter sp. C01]|uniref:GGDEF domain-containing protein n=1 Tax=Rhodanobacter sp. C01 TaxID=1945856 RepID=UPI000987335A|nr:diguanylate cyclase [Rhodanobacter sp. C01]